MTRISETSGSPPPLSAPFSPKARPGLGKSPAALNKQCEQLGPEQLLGMSAAWAPAGRTAASGAGRLAGEHRGGSDSLPEYSWISRCLASPPQRSPAPNTAKQGNQERCTCREIWGSPQRVPGCAWSPSQTMWVKISAKLGIPHFIDVETEAQRRVSSLWEPAAPS